MTVLETVNKKKTHRSDRCSLWVRVRYSTKAWGECEKWLDGDWITLIGNNHVEEGAKSA